VDLVDGRQAEVAAAVDGAAGKEGEHVAPDAGTKVLCVASAHCRRGACRGHLPAPRRGYQAA
jgi:hypothetical protein